MHPPHRALNPGVALAETVEALGHAVQRAQVAIDLATVDIATVMAGEGPDATLQIGGSSTSLLELGFTPTFYQAAEVEFEVRVDVQMSAERRAAHGDQTTETRQRRVGGWLFGTTHAETRTVDTRRASRYGIELAMSSVLHTRMITHPGPAALLELLDEAQARQPEEVR